MTKQAGIYRAQLDFEKGYVRAPNEWLRDPNLSLKAKGLLIYFLSHEVGYVITLAQIERETADGRAAIRAAIGELIEAGYLETDMTKDERGYNAGLAYTLKNPKCENPTLDYPTLENRTALRRQPLREDKELRTSVQNKFEQSDFDSFWLIYPRRQGKREALKSLKAALALADFETIIAGAKRYRDDPNRSPSYTKLPATWLNKGCWDDEPLPNRELTAEERQAVNRAKAERDRELSVAATRLRLEQDRLTEERAKANPAPRCEHNRIAVICDTCNRKSTTMKTQQLEG